MVKISSGKPQSDGTRAANFSGGDWKWRATESASVSAESWESEPPVVGERGTSSPGSLGDGFGVAVAAGDNKIVLKLVKCRIWMQRCCIKYMKTILIYK